jgi:nucleotide-binding universal stress UspA family protein
MKTLCETTSARLQENVLETTTSIPAEPNGQIYKRILVGTDFSEASKAAFEQGLKLAKQSGAELLLTHASTVPDTLSFMPAEAYDKWELLQRTETEKNIAGLVQRAHQEGVKAHRLLLQGLADDAILYAAKRLAVDLIVVGTHGHDKKSRFFSKSTGERVASHAPCAVLTARSPEPIA